MNLNQTKNNYKSDLELNVNHNLAKPLWMGTHDLAKPLWMGTHDLAKPLWM